MKVFLLLLFVFTFPIAVLLSSILFGGFSNTFFKNELIKSGVYTKISLYIQDLSFQEEDQLSEQFTDVLKNRFTNSYIKDKTEDTLDLATNWITGASETPPVISFAELKEDILAQYPQVLPELEEVAKEAKQQAIANGSEDGQQTMDMMQGLDSISTLAKSDFTIQLSSYLAPLKTLYNIIQLALPTSFVLMTIYLMFLLLFSHPWHARFTWIGATAMLSGIWGYTVVYMNAYLVYLMTTTISANANDIFSIFSPVLLNLANSFINIYAYYLGLVSIGAFLIAAICFIAAALMNTQSASSLQTKTLKKK